MARGYPASPSALRGQRVTVLGLGTKGGGSEVIKWLVRHGAQVVATDTKTAEELRPSLEDLRGLPVRYVLGEHRAADLQSTDLVMRNPAVPLESPMLRLASAAGVPVLMDTTLFFLFCPAPIAGVTGTRGKSTTTAVAGEILRRGRPDTVVAGNIQRSPLADLDRITPGTPVVLELSSWQLEGIAPLPKSPHWAVLTTILPDHLNHYPSMEAYVAAKETIVCHQTTADVAVMPIDDAWSEHFGDLTTARKTWFGDRRHRRIAVPDAPGLFRSGDTVLRSKAGGGPEEKVLSWSELGGTGDHTKRNMLAGALLALEMGAPLEDVREVLRSFRGLPNRLEVIREFQGRTWVNDTAATTPEAVHAALSAYRDRAIVLITGGTDKNLAYDQLAAVISTALSAPPIRFPQGKQIGGGLRAVVLLAGSATEKLLGALGPGHSAIGGRPPSLVFGPVRTMEEAVSRAFELSQPGDVILLSPGAASFELFRDEFDRGQQFRDAVSLRHA